MPPISWFSANESESKASWFFIAKSGEAEYLYFQNMAGKDVLSDVKILYTVHLKLRMFNMVDLVFSFSCYNILSINFFLYFWPASGQPSVKWDDFQYFLLLFWGHTSVTLLKFSYFKILEHSQVRKDRGSYSDGELLLEVSNQEPHQPDHDETILFFFLFGFSRTGRYEPIFRNYFNAFCL